MTELKRSPVDDNRMSPESQANMEALARTSEALNKTIPEYLGMTVFGSTARGEAGPESDVDICVFFDADRSLSFVEQREAEPEVVTEPGVFEGLVRYSPSAAWKIKKVDNQELSEQGGMTSADVWPLPVSERVVDNQVDLINRSVDRFRQGEGKLIVPRNIQGLFHAPIDTAGIAHLQRRALDQLSTSKHGEIAWSMIRQKVAYFELGKDSWEQEKRDVSHRLVPATLEEAANYYQ